MLTHFFCAREGLYSFSLIGIGMAMVYPNLCAAVGDFAKPKERTSLIGVYRFWRDMRLVRLLLP